MKENEEEDKVPVFKSWNGWYFLSALLLLILIVFFYLLTVLFNE